MEYGSWSESCLNFTFPHTLQGTIFDIQINILRRFAEIWTAICLVLLSQLFIDYGWHINWSDYAKLCYFYFELSWLQAIVWHIAIGIQAFSELFEWLHEQSSWHMELDTKRGKGGNLPKTEGYTRSHMFRWMH